MNLNFVFFKNFNDHENPNLIFLPRFKSHSKISREINIDVNSDVMIPIIRVVAKPFTGPVPYANSTIPVIRVVN
jgi:hypothetical protein